MAGVFSDCVSRDLTSALASGTTSSLHGSPLNQLSVQYGVSHTVRRRSVPVPFGWLPAGTDSTLCVCLSQCSVCERPGHKPRLMARLNVYAWQLTSLGFFFFMILIIASMSLYQYCYEYNYFGFFKSSLHLTWDSNSQPRDQESQAPPTESARCPKIILKIILPSGTAGQKGSRFVSVRSDGRGGWTFSPHLLSSSWLQNQGLHGLPSRLD